MVRPIIPFFSSVLKPKGGARWELVVEGSKCFLLIHPQWEFIIDERGNHFFKSEFTDNLPVLLFPRGVLPPNLDPEKTLFVDFLNGSRVVRGEEAFTDVYWRIYVKHPLDWTGGGPAKLSRATSLVSPGWRQAMIAHVWSSGEALTLDPASGVRGDRVVTASAMLGRLVQRVRIGRPPESIFW